MALIIGSFRDQEAFFLPGLVAEALGIALLVHTPIVKRQKPVDQQRAMLVLSLPTGAAP